MNSLGVGVAPSGVAGTITAISHITSSGGGLVLGNSTPVAYTALIGQTAATSLMTIGATVIRHSGTAVTFLLANASTNGGFNITASGSGNIQASSASGAINFTTAAGTMNFTAETIKFTEAAGGTGIEFLTPANNGPITFGGFPQSNPEGEDAGTSTTAGGAVVFGTPSANTLGFNVMVVLDVDTTLLGGSVQFATDGGTGTIGTPVTVLTPTTLGDTTVGCPVPAGWKFEFTTTGGTMTVANTSWMAY